MAQPETISPFVMCRYGFEKLTWMLFGSLSMGEAAKPLGFPLSEVSVRPVRDAAERAGGLPPAQRATAKAGDMDPMDAAKKMSDQIWKESWTHGPRGGRQHRAHRMRYLAVQGIRREPQIFGLSEEDAKLWRAAYETCLHNHLVEEGQPDADPHRDPELFVWTTLWARLDSTFGTPLTLPAANPACIRAEAGRDELCRRQAVRTIIG